MKNITRILLFCLLAPLSCLAQGYIQLPQVGKVPYATKTQRGVVVPGNGTKVNGTGILSVDPILSITHLDGSSATPTVSATVGAGTSATATLGLTSSDMAGTVTIITGSSPTAGGVIFHINFATPYTSPPFVQVRAYNATAAPTNATTYPANVTTTGFDLQLITGSSIPAGTNIFCYQIIQ